MLKVMLNVEYLMFNADFKCSNCPSARCTLAANAIGSDTSVFNGCSVLGNMINKYLVLLLHNIINSHL